MPEPGSKKFDKRRARMRREAEDQGIPDQRANEDAKSRLQEDPLWRSRGDTGDRGGRSAGRRRER